MDVDLLADGKLKLSFPYSQKIVSLVRQMPGRWWHPEPKYWSIPPSSLRELQMQAARMGEGVSVSEPVQQLLNLGTKRRAKLMEIKADTSAISLPTDTTPRPFQNSGIRFLKYALHNFHGALLADDMGLGKTFQALSIVVLHPKVQRVLVVVPLRSSMCGLKRSTSTTPS